MAEVSYSSIPQIRYQLVLLPICNPKNRYKLPKKNAMQDKKPSSILALKKSKIDH